MTEQEKTAWQSALLSLLVAGAFLAVVLTYAQTSGLAPPALTGSKKSMQQYESLRVHVERDGPLDFIILGNSAARQGVNMVQLHAELEEARGRRVRGYNFASGGTAATMLPFTVELAYGVDRPRDCLIVLLPRMLIAAWTITARNRVRMTEQSPYALALSDPLPWRRSIRRFLLDHVAASGLRYSVRGALLGEDAAPRKVGAYDEQFGYRRVVERPEKLQWEKLRSRLRDWAVHEDRIRGLTEAIELAQSYGAGVWLVEGALHPQAIASMADPVSNMRLVRDMIRGVSENTGAHALMLPEDLPFSASEFVDTSHLTGDGAARYTHWLAQALLEYPDAIASEP